MCQKKGLYLIIFLSCLTACASSRNWTGDDLPGNNSASFQELNGDMDFKLKLKEDAPFYFKYTVNVEKGSLRLLLKSKKGTIHDKNITGSATDSIFVNEHSGGPYRMTLSGANASGKYVINYANR
jgi:hypothetical protein